MLKRGVSHSSISPFPLSSRSGRSLPAEGSACDRLRNNSRVWPLPYPLSRKPQQPKHINPKHRHKMPIPRRDVHHNPPRLDRLVQQGSARRPQQRNHPPRQMQRMCNRQQKYKRTAGIRIHKKPASMQFPPSQPLPRKKCNPQQNRNPQPRKRIFVPSETPGIDFTGASSRLPRRIAAAPTPSSRCSPAAPLY